MALLRRSRIRLILTILLAIAITVHAQRRGGGGDGDDDYDDNGGNGGNGGGGGGGGEGRKDDNDPDGECRIYAQYKGANWLHRWIGSYYNGTIEVILRMNESWAQCEQQEREVNKTFDGVLSLLDPRYAGQLQDNQVTAGSNPFIFTLAGWPQDTTQEQLAGHRADGFLPRVTDFFLESLLNFRGTELWRSLDQPVDRLDSPTCRVTNVTRQDGAYNFACDYAHPDTSTDLGRWMMPMSVCNGSRTSPLAVQMAPSIPSAPGVYSDPSPSVVQNLLLGSFDADEADFRWEGTFRADFVPFGDDQRGESWNDEDEELYYGHFEALFRGRIDRENGYEMNSRSRQKVTWVEDNDKLKAQHYCPGSGAGGLSLPSGTVFMAVAAVCLSMAIA